MEFQSHTLTNNNQQYHRVNKVCHLTKYTMLKVQANFAALQNHCVAKG